MQKLLLLIFKVLVQDSVNSYRAKLATSRDWQSFYFAEIESFIRQQSSRDHHSNRGNWKYRGRGGGNYRSNNNQRSSERTWHRYPKQPSEYSKEQEEFMQMAPSKMMTAKEKEWIFKISLMSLLSGDPNISDYYFVVGVFIVFLVLSVRFFTSKLMESISKNITDVPCGRFIDGHI